MRLKNYIKNRIPKKLGVFCIMFNLSLKIKSFFVKKPTKKLSWTVEDYELGKKFAKSQPHPFLKYKTLWDLCYDKIDSVNTIDNLNKFIFREI